MCIGTKLSVMQSPSMQILHSSRYAVEKRTSPWYHATASVLVCFKVVLNSPDSLKLNGSCLVSLVSTSPLLSLPGEPGEERGHRTHTRTQTHRETHARTHREREREREQYALGAMQGRSSPYRRFPPASGAPAGQGCWKRSGWVSGCSRCRHALSTLRFRECIGHGL